MPNVDYWARSAGAGADDYTQTVCNYMGSEDDDTARCVEAMEFLLAAFTRLEPSTELAEAVGARIEFLLCHAARNVRHDALDLLTPHLNCGVCAWLVWFSGAAALIGDGVAPAEVVAKFDADEWRKRAKLLGYVTMVRPGIEAFTRGGSDVTFARLACLLEHADPLVRNAAWVIARNCANSLPACKASDLVKAAAGALDNAHAVATLAAIAKRIPLTAMILPLVNIVLDEQADECSRVHAADALDKMHPGCVRDHVAPGRAARVDAARTALRAIGDAAREARRYAETLQTKALIAGLCKHPVLD